MLMSRTKSILGAVLVAAFFVSAVSISGAQEFQVTAKRPGGALVLRTPVYYSWMSPEVSGAWGGGFLGQKTTITVVDDFKSPWGYYGDLTGTTQLLRHGEWTRLEASLIAPSATIKSKDFSLTNTAVSLSSGLNVLNLSYGMFAKAGYTSVRWGRQESSIISYATNGKAVISKAAGNDSVAVGGVNSDGQQDYLNLALVGKQSAIFVGALDDNNGTLARYSNTAGPNPSVQSHFLVVGVEGTSTGLYGTSFAAPIISGYASIVGSKFSKATPTQIVNQLLLTAREDTVKGYDISIHGQGEASLARALAPIAIIK